MVAALSACALAVTAFLSGVGPAHAFAESSPIIGVAYNSSANSNCAYAGLQGTARVGVAFSPANATGTTHLVGTAEDGIFEAWAEIQNSATKVDYINDCINGDWYYAYAAAYPANYVHRSITLQFYCDDGCFLYAINYGGWTADWAGPQRP